jgi:hypothetical protein
LLPLTYPPTDFLWAARQAGLAGHFSRSAKFICMGKQKNRLTATKRRNHFARIFDMRAHMSKPTTASRMVVISPSCDACGRRESCFCARSRVGGWTWWFSGPRRIFQLPWSSIRLFCRSSHLPYTSSNFKRPPRLGERWQRGVPYTVVIISSTRIDWYPPIGGGGHAWRDAPVGSTFLEIQLTIA